MRLHADTAVLKPAHAWLPAGLARTLGLLGLGMLVWACVSTALLQGRGDAFVNLRPFQDRTLGAGFALALCWGWALWPQPADTEQRRWRPRALAALGLVLLATAALLLLLHVPAHSPGLIAIAGAIACMGALAAVVLGTQALEPAASPWLPPAQSALALLAGAVLFFAFMVWLWPGQMAGGSGPTLVLLGAISAALLMASWASTGRALLLPLHQHWPRWLLLLGVLLLPMLLTLVPALKPTLQKPLWCLAVLGIAAAVLVDGRLRRGDTAEVQNGA
ncbi:MAG TPA: hypothetical protein VM687_04620 [Stenotrophomonas sp.]|nr:hypothetical protein [Stenotrophomonas sp.]